MPKGSAVKVYRSNGQSKQPVPNVIGMTFGDAKDTLKDAGFTNVTRVCEEAEPDADPSTLDTVVAQDPAEAKPKDQITLTVRQVHCP